jgi:hypothetical protein
VIDHTATPVLGFSFINGTFTDNLQAVVPGLASISGTLNNVCGAGSQLSGTTVLTVTGISLQPGTTCTFSVMLQVPASAAAATYTNTTSTFVGDVTTVPLSAFNMAPVSATLQVTAAPSTGTPVPAASPASVAPSITSFLQSRAILLRSVEPDLARRHQRVSGASDPVDPPAPLEPVDDIYEGIYSDQAPPGSKEAAGLRYVRMLAEATRQAAISGSYGSPSVELALFGPGENGVDIWAEGNLAFHTQGGAEGIFGAAFAGIDVNVGTEIIVGAMVQYDNAGRANSGTGEAHTAQGWAVGPYLTARLGNGLLLDLRAAYGGSANTISPVGTYVDAYSVANWLVSGSLTGEIAAGNTSVEPQLHGSLYQQIQEAFSSSTGAVVPRQTIGLGQGAAGLGIRHVLTETGEVTVALRGRALLIGDYTFVNSAAGAGRLHGRAEIGADLVLPSEARIEFAVNYDGWGLGSLQVFGGRAKLAVQIN